MTMEPQVADRVGGLRSLVGNSPLLTIELSYREKVYRVYAKAENLNMTGSIKDRMAIHILRRGYEKGLLTPGGLIVEATSGNTGISFSAIGAALGHPVSIFMPDWMSAERLALIRSFGATIHPVSKEDGGFLGSIEMAEKLASETEGAFLPRQFANEDNSAAHEEATGPEIWWQLGSQGLQPDAFVAGVGTGGTVMGVGRFLRSMKPDVRLHPLEPASSPTLTEGTKVGKHRIQGISDEFIPPIVDLSFLNEIVAVDDGDAILMAQKLARQLGLGVGISSGANLVGAVKILEKMRPGAVVATVFSDSNKKYLSTDLLGDEPVRDEYLSPHVQLRGLRSFRRVCRTCFDPADEQGPARWFETTAD